MEYMTVIGIKIPDNSTLEKAQLLSILYNVPDKSLGLVFKEAVCSQGRNQIHYEIRDRPMP